MQAYSIDTDVYEKKTSGFIDPKTLKELSKVHPWRGVLQIALEWAGIAGAIVLCQAYWSPLLYIATVAWIGARQNGLAVMMHESVHYRLLPNRTWNDWTGEIFASWPILITVDSYRQVHFTHHRHLSTEDDPDYLRKRKNFAKYFPQNATQLAITTLKYWVGYYAVLELLEFNNETKIPAKLQLWRRVFYAVVLLASIVFHFWMGLLIYWMVPLFTYFLWVIYIRTITEHGIEDHGEVLQKTRHVEANLLGRLMIAPNYIHVHAAHHLYPSVPFYNLSKLQGLLMQHPDYASQVYVANGFTELLRKSFKANQAYLQAKGL